jgi:hypothetical protein
MNTRLLAKVNLRDALFGGHQGAQDIADSPTAFLSAILPNIFTIAGLLLLVYLVAGGLMVIKSAGSEGKGKGKDAITNALVGFIIIFASYWIVQIVQIITGIPILNSNVSF